MSTTPEEAQDPLKTAKEDLTNNVSVAGWKEALGEPIPWIRRCFQCSVIFLLCSCIYYNCKNISQFMAASIYVDEINDVFNVESIPASNVTICAQLYMNRTFIAQSLAVPYWIIESYQRATRHQFADHEFYRRLALFLSLTARQRAFSAKELILFSKVMRVNPHLQDFSSFVSSAYLPCKQMFKRCWFDGKEFDCCAIAMQSLDDDGICYVLPLNHNADNTQAAPRTFYQTTPGPRGGLSVEASVPLQDFPWLDEDAQNGFRVYVNSVHYTAVTSPVTAPHAAETFIKVVPTLHALAADCATSGHLARMKRPEFAYHDPEGLSCTIEHLADMFLNFGACNPIFYNFRPNSSAVCNPLITYVMLTAIATGSIESFVPSSDYIGQKGLEIVRHQEEIVSATATQSRSRCQTHCRYWTFTSGSSFADMIQPNHVDQQSMDAKIHVYYADFGYREYVQTKKTNVYMEFCSFGSVANFCLGMSIVSFFDVIYHVTKYWNIRRRIAKYAKGDAGTRKRAKVIGRNRVAPDVAVVCDTQM